MNLMPVSSSDIKAIGYEPNTQTLQVEFLNNSLYEYYAVPSYVYNVFKTAISKGSYFNAHIKKHSIGIENSAKTLDRGKNHEK